MLTKVLQILHTEIVKKKSVHRDHHEFVVLAAGAIILLIVFCGFFTVKNNPEYIPSQILNLVQLDRGENVRPNVQANNTEMSVTEFASNLNTKTGELMDVTGGNSSGQAYILRKETGLKHMVVADLPAPQNGLVYEGWLVKQGTEMEFFSTGVMERQYDGKYTLMYEDDERHEGFDFVVITLEEDVDATPETHVLEGRAK